ncbi:unnamed protein product [Nippostrongylus brasiliensis]|uniref:CCHC-type domain-containing protein n=1 Tax=Nippostrongylus brasiliensis TaxID=27835 RepID=A0A0N4XJ47_NIPBR|nr:unnamed protein product [Nippostrongylus brasiliensis]
MDEVDLAIHFDPLMDAVKELKSELSKFICDTNNRLDALHQELASHRTALMGSVDEILLRTAPKSNCLFCSVEDNKDSHPTGRCCRFPDPVSRAVQASTLRLCNKCLQRIHPDDCGIRCSFCGREHNVLLCPEKATQAQSYKRRKN